MANLSDFLPAAGGGGGGIPKYQEFTTSGTFTPPQALIDAGGRINVFLVGGGSGSNHDSYGGGGGEVKMFIDTLTSTSNITVTIGATSSSNSGNASTWNGDDAGGTLVEAKGGTRGNSAGNYQDNQSSPSWGARSGGSTPGASAGTGVFGYGAGGSAFASGGVRNPEANSGQGAYKNYTGAAGYLKLTWFE